MNVWPVLFLGAMEDMKPVNMEFALRVFKIFVVFRLQVGSRADYAWRCKAQHNINNQK